VSEIEAPSVRRPRFHALTLTNFLSYKSGRLVFDDFVALVGPNASGKSNAVAAIKLLREIPIHGLPTAIARRGGFDQLRHRSAGRPYDPALRLSFSLGDEPESSYELKLGAVAGKRYTVKHEAAVVHAMGTVFEFVSDGKKVRFRDAEGEDRSFPVPPGQSAMTSGGSVGGYFLYDALQAMQTVEVNPALVGELQDPSSTQEFEPDGSNTTSIYDLLSSTQRAELVDELSAIVPGISRIEVNRFADKQTLSFVQETSSGKREFFAKQMSDGTLRSFAILLAMLQPSNPSLLVIEEPEIAIHLGALRTLVDILQQATDTTQIVVTTHSADIVDAVPVESLRVVWSDGGSSRLSPVADHTKAVVQEGLITPGQLLRADSLDPAVA
jgi:predicted ATPase